MTKFNNPVKYGQQTRVEPKLDIPRTQSYLGLERNSFSIYDRGH